MPAYRAVQVWENPFSTAFSSFFSSLDRRSHFFSNLAFKWFVYRVPPRSQVRIEFYTERWIAEARIWRSNFGFLCFSFPGGNFRGSRGPSREKISRATKGTGTSWQRSSRPFFTLTIRSEKFANAVECFHMSEDNEMSHSLPGWREMFPMPMKTSKRMPDFNWTHMKFLRLSFSFQIWFSSARRVQFSIFFSSLFFLGRISGIPTEN